MCLIIEYQSTTTIEGNISLACRKWLGDECANAAVDRQLIRTKISVIYYRTPNFRFHPIPLQREAIIYTALCMYKIYMYLCVCVCVYTYICIFYNRVSDWLKWYRGWV